MGSLSLFQVLWKNRHLLWQFTLRNVELRHKGSHLGLIWSFLNPLFMVSLYVLVFGFIFRGRFKADVTESRIEFALVVFLGLSIYHFIGEVIGISPSVILTSPNLVKKVVFPLEILPVASVGAALFHFLVTLVLVFVGAAIAGVPVTKGALLLPVILVPLFGIAVGIALLLSSVGVFWRDIAQVTQFAVLTLMFASAVFYPLSQIPAAAWTFLKFNPLLHAINEARNVVFWGAPLNPKHVLYLYACAVAAVIAGSTAFRRLRNSFADVL